MKKVYILLYVLLLGIGAMGQDVKQAEAHIKVVYLYNFSRYIEWPSGYNQSNFVIGVLNGSHALISELNKMAASKTAGSQKFIIKNFTSVTQVSKCNILFVPGSSNAQLPEVLKKIRGYSTLLVTEYMGDAKKGADINFVSRDSRQEFELNKSNAEKRRLVVGSILSTLAVTSTD